METIFRSEKVRAWRELPGMLRLTRTWVLNRVDVTTWKVLATFFFICLRVSCLGKVSVLETKRKNTTRSKSAKLDALLKLCVWATQKKCRLIWTTAETLVLKRPLTTGFWDVFSASSSVNVSLKMSIFTTGLSKDTGLKCPQPLFRTKNKNKMEGLPQFLKASKIIQEPSQKKIPTSFQKVKAKPKQKKNGQTKKRMNLNKTKPKLQTLYPLLRLNSSNCCNQLKTLLQTQRNKPKEARIKKMEAATSFDHIKTLIT